MSNWELMAQCPSCGWGVRADFKIIPYDCCPKCGKLCTKENGEYNWTIVVAREAWDYSLITWWQPWTWFNRIRKLDVKEIV